MVVYAAYTTCLSVVLLQYEPNPSDKKLIDTSMAVLAIILLALSLYLNTKSFKDRAARFKSGYHDLHDIENRLKALLLQSPANGGTASYVELSDQYNKALRDIENHAELDDIRSKIVAGAGLTSRRLTKIEVCRYYWWRIWRFVALVLAYSTPAAVVVWFIYK